MRLLYAYFKVMSVIAVTLGVYAAFIVGYGLLRFLNRPVDNWRNVSLSAWGRWAAKALSIKVHVKGTVPKPPFFLVSNHLSYIDIIVLFSQLNTTFVAKSEVEDWPVIGFIARTVGVVFIDRTRRSDLMRVNEEISNSVTDQRGLTLFPEGTTSPGSEVLRFRASLLEYPARSELGAHYCALSYSTNTKESKDEAYKIVSWWDETTLNAHIVRLAKQPIVHATITFGSSVIKERDRKILSKKLHLEVSRLFNPMCSSRDTEFEPLQF